VYLAASYSFRDVEQTLYTDKAFSETYALDESYFKKTLPDARALPFNEMQSEGEAIWNATIPGGPPLIGFAKSVSASNSSDKSSKSASAPRFAMIAFVRADRLASWFGQGHLNDVILVNRQGQVLVDGDQKKMAAAASYAAHPLFKAASGMGFRSGVANFDFDGGHFLGAHSSGYDGKIIVFSQIDGRHAFTAVDRLIQRSLVFAMIAITLAFLAAIFFSRSLTKPIQALVDAMNRVAKGELHDSAINVGTRDEIALLATSFNKMLADLSASREALEQINRELEQKVKDRTRKLEETNIAVKKAQESLLQSTRMATVGEVAGRAAHEVLNPLTSIVTRLEKVRSRVKTGAVQEVALVREIVESWNQDVNTGGVEKLIEAWKGPSSVTQGQSLLQEDISNIQHVESAMTTEFEALMHDMDFLLKESQRINKIVQSMRELTLVKGELEVTSAHIVLHEASMIMFDLAEHHGVEIVEDFKAADDFVKFDTDEFIQVITNLIRNSIQSIKARRLADPQAPKGQITIATSYLDESLVIDIGDNGIGIPEQYRTKLFEMQFSTKGKDEGTGLGLTISRRFVRAFGGDMELLKSAPNDGCTFRIQLPVVENVDEIERLAV
ncbi:MAG: ATP-binding protein, partial [Bdellovibrionota bacterium]